MYGKSCLHRVKIIFLHVWIIQWAGIFTEGSYQFFANREKQKMYFLTLPCSNNYVNQN